MHIRPTDLPLLRASALSDLSEKKFLDPTGEGFPQLLQKDLLRGVPTGELFFVSPLMASLAVEAAKTLPDFTLEVEDLVSPSGFMMFGSPVSYFEETDVSSSAEVTGVMWGLEHEGVGALTYLTGSGSRIRAHSLGFFILGRDVERPDPDGSTFGSTSKEVQGVLKAAWLLMQQPIATESVPSPDRPTRRRMKRLGVPERPVRVIELRRSKSTFGNVESGREYHHQWIVRGHWRQHWHPKRQVRRPVWIAPHIKGPEDAPLLGGEKVYAWKR